MGVSVVRFDNFTCLQVGGLLGFESAYGPTGAVADQGLPIRRKRIENRVLVYLRMGTGGKGNRASPKKEFLVHPNARSSD